MSKVEEQPLPSYTDSPIPKTAKRSKRFWLLAVLAGILTVTVNFRTVLKTTSWKPPMGCGKGRLHITPKSHYTLPSGDKIPSVALGGSPPFLLAYRPN